MQTQIRPLFQHLQESATLATNLRVKQIRGEGSDICHLAFGESPFPIHPKIAASLSENAHQNKYLPSQGLSTLREQAANYLSQRGRDFNKEQLFIGPGSKELIFGLFLLFDGPIYLLSPSWVSYAPQARLAQKKYYFIPTLRKNNYKITPEDLEKNVAKKPGQKLLVINSPCNPTGVIYSQEEVASLTDICRKYNVLVLSDEIYFEIYFTQKRPVSFSQLYPEGTFVTTGMSKFFSAGGWRLGLMGIPWGQEKLFRAFVSLISETFSAVASPIQYAAITAFEEDPEIASYVDLCRQIHRTCGTYLWKRFTDLGLNCPYPQGSFYLFADFENFKKEIFGTGISNIEDLCQLLLRDFHLALLPGTAFFTPPDYLAFRAAFVDYDGAKVLKAASTGVALDDSFVETHCPSLPKAIECMEIFLKNLDRIGQKGERFSYSNQNVL